mgnify:CR=1 FL=1
MALLMMLLAALNVAPFNAPLTQEEVKTRECHEYCDGVEARVNERRDNCSNMTTTDASGGHIHNLPDQFRNDIDRGA